jgi:pathogenesis-related protein 1
MRTINFMFIAIALLVIGMTSVTEARNSFWAVSSDRDNLRFTLPALGNKYCPKADSPLTDAEIDEIIRIHNQTRREVGTTPLKWNCALADFAQKWANKDTFEHSSEKEREGVIPGSLIGENLSNDSDSNQVMQKLIQGWIDEKAFLSSDAKTCAPGKVCGHYTQMVWKTTTEVGCGVFRKSNTLGAEYKGQATYFVCVYNPGGNDGNAAY